MECSYISYNTKPPVNPRYTRLFYIQLGGGAAEQGAR